RQCVYLFRGGIGGTRESRWLSRRTGKSSLGGNSTDRPFGRGTDSDTRLADPRLSQPVPHGHANCRPIIGAQRRALRISTANTGRLRGDSHFRDQLVFRKRSLIVAYKEF